MATWAAPMMAVAAIGLILVMSAWSAGTNEPRSAFEVGGEGPSPLVEDARALDLETLRLLAGPQALRADPDHDPRRTLLVVVAPERGYDDNEASSLRTFLDQGGRLLVVDNYGQANSLSVPFGITFERVRLLEESEDGVTGILDRREFTLSTRNPTALHLDPDLDAEILARSSEESFLDRDGDGLIQAEDPLGPFVLGAKREVGTQGGFMVALSDPYLVSPEGADEADNRRFRQALLEHMLPEGGVVIIDESRTPTPDPWLLSGTVFVGSATQDPWRTILAVLAVGLFALGLIMATQGKWGPHRFSVDHFIRRASLIRGSATGPEATTAREPQRKRGPDAPRKTKRGRAASARWTSRGKAAILGGVVLAVFGLVVGNLQATYAASFLFLGATLAMWTRPGRLRAERRFASDRIHEEMATDIDLIVEAEKAAEVEIRDALPREFELARGHNWFQTRLRPKTKMAFHYEVRGALRGPYDVGPLKVRTSDPFHLRTIESRVLEPADLLVIPRHKPLSRIPFKSKIPVLTLGPHLVNRAGDGTEFHALRDYQAGDSIRIVNWKASARSKDLVVNQRVHESMATIAVFLDARAVSGAGPARKTPLNEGCRAVLSVVTGALQARDKVRVFVYGDGVRELSPGSGAHKAYEVSKALAELEPRGSTSFAEAVQEALPEMKPRSPVVIASGLENDEGFIRGVKLLGQRGLLPFVLALEIGTQPEPDPGTGNEGGPEPDAGRLQREWMGMIQEIRAAEVPVVPVVPGIPLNTLFQVGVA